MSVDEMELVGRLGHVEPLPDEAFEQARAVLEAAIAVESTPQTSPAGSRRHWHPRRTKVVGGTLGAGIAADGSGRGSHHDGWYSAAHL